MSGSGPGPGLTLGTATGVQHLLNVPSAEALPPKQCYEEIWILSIGKGT